VRLSAALSRLAVLTCFTGCVSPPAHYCAYRPVQETVCMEPTVQSPDSYRVIWDGEKWLAVTETASGKIPVSSAVAKLTERLLTVERDVKQLRTDFKGLKKDNNEIRATMNELKKGQMLILDRLGEPKDE